MRKLNIDVTSLSETNLHFNNPQVKKQYKKSAENCSHKTINHIRNSPHMTVKYKPGGTTMIITNALSHKGTKSGQDTEGLGRWSITTIEGKTKTRSRS